MRLLFAVATVLGLATGAPAAADPAAPAALAPAAPARTSGWPEGMIPQAPANFRVIAFARGLDGPRSLLVLPNGDVLVAESRGAATGGAPSANRVTLLRDTTGAGVADTRFALVTGLERPAGLALRRDRLLIANTDALLSCPFLVGQTRLHGECHPILDLPAAGGHDHWARTLALNPEESRLFIGIGSSGDSDPDYRDASDRTRATILDARPDGHDAKTFASGLRDPGALTFDPSTSHLYATVSERALPDGSRAGDFFTRIADGAFYGWPWAVLGKHEDPRRAGQHAELVAKTVAPDVLLPPGSSPLGAVFYSREQFPKDYRGAAFIALAGTPGLAGGYKVVAIPFRDGRPSGPPEDFLTGFTGDAPGAEVYGRPVAVAVATDGTLLVADEIGNTVWRVIFKCAACTPDPYPVRRLDPRPAR